MNRGVCPECGAEIALDSTGRLLLHFKPCATTRLPNCGCSEVCSGSNIYPNKTKTIHNFLNKPFQSYYEHMDRFLRQMGV